MQNRNFMLSFIIAGVGMLMVWLYVESSKKESSKYYGNMQKVWVAAREIKEQEIITRDHLTEMEVPAHFIQPYGGEYKQPNREMIEGQVAQVSIQKGEQILLNKITSVGVRTGLSRQVSPGKRAMAIPVSDDTGVSKMIKPGDRVDVLGVVRIPQPNGGDKKEVRLLLQDVIVLSIGTFVANDIPKSINIDANKAKVERNLSIYTGYNTVSLEVEPSQAQTLAYIAAAGGGRDIVLTLRNNDDKGRIPASITGLQEVLQSSQSFR